MRQSIARGGAAALCAFTVSSCAAININSLPQPGESFSGNRTVVMEFESVLNLPDRARVVLDGTTVGVVMKVEPSSQLVNVTAQIDSHAAVPSNIHAALQQSTVLGDIYIALQRPDDNEPPAPALSAGGKVPLAHTLVPPPLETSIANLANFVTSGSIQRIQNTMINLDKVQPAGGEPALRKIVSRVAADIEDLGQNVDTVDQWLDGLSKTGQVMHDHIPTFQFWFSPKGMAGFDRALWVGSHVGKLFPSLGTIWGGGYWLVPLIKSLADGFGALQQNKWVFEDEYPAWQKLFNNYFIPEDKRPAINITSIVGPDGKELSGDVHNVLRILGAAQ